MISRLSGASYDIKKSIAGHVRDLLNTRRGSVLHLPDYGLPEYCMHHQVLQEKKKFILEIKQLVERYEPRITSLTISEMDAQRHDCVLQLKLVATLANTQLFVLNALLLGGGDLMVNQHDKNSS